MVVEKEARNLSLSLSLFSLSLCLSHSVSARETKKGKVYVR